MKIDKSNQAFVCGSCGRSFNTKRGLGVHQATGHDKPWHDPDVLKELYIKEELGSVTIARRFGTSKKNILRWLNIYGINTRPENKHRPPSFMTDTSGYECWATQYDGDSYNVYVHRLLAISEYGFDRVAGSVIHHKNGIKWDNRPENIQVFDSHSDHARHHANNREFEYRPWRDKELLHELYIERGYSTYEIADMFECSRYAVNKWLHRFDIPTRPPNR